MQFRILHYEAFIPLAEVSKYQHMWSFFGRSYNYNLFIGLVEFSIGALIVFRRSRLIALLISLGLCLNILILNVEFDIHFAIQHILLDFAITLILLFEYRKDLYGFFVRMGGKLIGQTTQGSHWYRNKLPLVYLILLSSGYFMYAIELKINRR